MRWRDLGALAALALLLALLAASPLAIWLAGPSLDSAMALRHRLPGLQAKPTESAAVVVALDEETYRRPPFQATPQAAWTPHLAKVLRAVHEAGAGVIGFDLVFPTSLETMQRGYDRDFLLTLRQVARDGKLVLGKVQHAAQPIQPHPMQQLAVGGGANIRSLNVLEDGDGIIRRLPLSFALPDGAGREPAFAAELAQRLNPALATSTGTLLLNFSTRPGAIPSYSLADLLACAEAGDAAYFARHFAGKAVLFATVLDVEDRRLTSLRHATVPEGSASPPRCKLEPLPLHRADLARDSIPGAYIHATAINNLLHGNALREVPVLALFGAALILAGGMLLAAFALPLSAAGGIAAALLVIVPGAAAWLLHQGYALPWIGLEAAVILALGTGTGYRMVVTDHDKRLIAKLFALYLPGSVIDGMLRSGRLPKLGGEEREVTVLFSDIAGFTHIAENAQPTLLVQALNNYFSAMTEIIEAHGGFVDKFIGDAIVAVFGAPADDPQHAAQAVRAALAMRNRLRQAGAAFGIDGAIFQTRIGVNSGRVLIGNIGAPRRFNYTVIGDAVNLATRLEGANKYYGSSILASETTKQAAGDICHWRLIDQARVLGREQPVALLEPLDHTEATLSEIFTAAWSAIQQRDFSAAANILSALHQDAAAQQLLARLQSLQAAPASPWPPVTDLTGK